MSKIRDFLNNTFKKEKEEKAIPETLEECFEFLSKMQDVQIWLDQPEDDAVASAHFSMGMWIRNNWGLWSKEGKLYQYFQDMGLFHADDMSSVILISFHRKMNNKPMDVEGQVKYYIEYWKKTSDK